MTTIENAPDLVDYRLIVGALRERGLLPALRRLYTPLPLHSTFALLLDWALIFAGWALVWYGSFWFAPLSLVLIGSRQRALGNLLHEAGHKMLYGNSRVNDLVGSLVIALPFLTLLPYYRQDHYRHHAYLSSSELDPELIHSEQHRGLSAWQLFWAHALDAKMFKTNVLAGFPSMTSGERLLVLLWWAVFLGLFSLATGYPGALCFALLWFGAKMTAFHAITTFREISDHVGMEPGTVIGFTRNSPHRPWLSLLLHPHYNNYHLTHHLAPRVPFPRVKQAHQILLQIPEYAAAHHCDTYFTGGKSLIACWVGKCLRWHRAKGQVLSG